MCEVALPLARTRLPVAAPAPAAPTAGDLATGLEVAAVAPALRDGLVWGVDGPSRALLPELAEHGAVTAWCTQTPPGRPDLALVVRALEVLDEHDALRLVACIHGLGSRYLYATATREGADHVRRRMACGFWPQEVPLRRRAGAFVRQAPARGAQGGAGVTHLIGWRRLLV